jgi:catechol 2,3-dioxygenase-like lactoylglutathione lyase family enzyme
MAATLPARHHLAYVTHDVEATTHFYTRVLGMPLVNAVMDDKIPSTGAPFPYLHIFFRMGDGATIAFFEVPGIPVLPLAPDHPVYKTFNHVALEVGSRPELDAWEARLREHGVDLIRHDHGIIDSIYFHDPNGVRLELTTSIDKEWNNRGEAATAALDRWIAAKKKARESGADEVAALRELALSESHGIAMGRKPA